MSYEEMDNGCEGATPDEIEAASIIRHIARFGGPKMIIYSFKTAHRR